MRIAVNGYFLGQETTGSGQYVHHLLQALLAEDGGHRYEVLAPEGAGLPGGEAAEGLRVTQLPRRLPNEDLAKAWFEQATFPRACRKAGAALAHIPYFAPPLFPTLPTLVTVHDLIPLVLPAYRGDLRVRAYMRLVALAARRADAILTDSLAAKRDIVRLLRIPEGRVRVTYLAAGPRYRPEADRSGWAEVRARYDLPERYILYLGGYDQRRNVGTLLRAFAEVVGELGQRGETASLALAGGLPAQDSAFTPDPRRLIRELGLGAQVRCLGRVREEDKPALYRGADLFVFPSSYEGFGLPLLEAMACGTPVIAADATSLPEIVGDGGLLVGTTDVRAWAAAMLSLWSDGPRRAALAAAGLAQAARFSWRRTARETLEVYEAVAYSRKLAI